MIFLAFKLSQVFFFDHDLKLQSWLLSMVEFVVVTGGLWGLAVTVAWGIAKRGLAQCSKVHEDL